MAARIPELMLDIKELSNLLELASRQKPRDILSLEVRKLQTELTNLQNQEPVADQRDPSSLPVKSGSLCYDVKISNYAWDQTAEFVKLYVKLDQAHTIPQDSVTCKFGSRSLDLRVHNLNNKNYSLAINNLCEDINTENSSFKLKTNMIVVTLAKMLKDHWQCVTGVEKRIKDSKKSSMADAAKSIDPETGLMNLMKKMYQDGDDEMKRTIAKAWTEKSSEMNMGYAMDS